MRAPSRWNAAATCAARGCGDCSHWLSLFPLAGGCSLLVRCSRPLSLSACTPPRLRVHGRFLRDHFIKRRAALGVSNTPLQVAWYVLLFLLGSSVGGLFSAVVVVVVAAIVSEAN